MEDIHQKLCKKFKSDHANNPEFIQEINHNNLYGILKYERPLKSRQGDQTK